VLKIPEDKVLERLRAENPWWAPGGDVSPLIREWRPRPYLNRLLPLVSGTEVRRAVILMGPRRVGKTVLIHHAIANLLDAGVEPSNIGYVSVDHPLYNGLGLEDFVRLLGRSGWRQADDGPAYLFFDEIQYLREWEVHLKSLVDSRPALRVVASGSAAAALRLKSIESGAGRFTDFILPPLTFFEYLVLSDLQGLLEAGFEPGESFRARETSSLNEYFLHYLNFGGYPEVVFSPQIQKDPGRFIKADIIDKVLLRDLPTLYGIQDIQELNSLFTTLAFNTAGEVSLEELARGSGVGKNTLKRYITYLEAAFLIRVVHRIDENARRFRRANFFKVYLTNPSMRAAIFAPMTADGEGMGSLVETAIFSQWFHSSLPLHYARWQRGEIDIVSLRPDQKPEWVVETKWSDRVVKHPEDLRSLVRFCKRNGVRDALVTTRTIRSEGRIDGIPIRFVPASEYCLTLGRDILANEARR